jgi:uncharacterized protein YutE (UPF0331/DUF86 family)
MHRADLNLPAELKNIVAKSNFQNPIEDSLSKRLVEALDWSDEIEYAKRLYKKAVFNKEKRQYFKAVASLYEAIAVVSCLVIEKRNNGNNLNPNEYKDRFYAVNDQNYGIRTELENSENDKLKDIKDLRNIILHGTESSDPNENQTALAAIKDGAKYLEIFEGGQEVFNIIFNKVKR